MHGGLQHPAEAPPRAPEGTEFLPKMFDGPIIVPDHMAVDLLGEGGAEERDAHSVDGPDLALKFKLV
jgi:hypothetical protein